jgi:hypothetical protein
MVGLLDSSTLEPLDPLPPHDNPSPTSEVASVEKEREEAGVHVFRSASGMPILVRTKPGSAIAHVGLHAIGGVRDEDPDFAGITTLAMRTS